MSIDHQPLVSIVLPVYNGEKYLDLSISSCVGQTYQNWELLIIDDGSTDRSAEIAKKYEAMDSRVHYYKNEVNLRLPRSLNRGFSLSKGEYLTWTSDDNYYRPHAIETLVSKLKEGNAELVFSEYTFIDDTGKELENRTAPKEYKHIMWDHNLVGACFMYTRKAYEAVGEYDPDVFLGEDYDYWLRIFARFDVEYIDQNLYAYRIHEKSLTSTLKKEQYAAVEKVLLKNFKDKKDAELLDYYYLYKALHRSRIYQDSFVKRYKYYPGLCWFRLRHKLRKR